MKQINPVQKPITVIVRVVIHVWLTVLLLGSILGGLDSAAFYPPPQDLGMRWPSWVFWQVACALICMILPTLAYAVLLIPLTVCLQQSHFPHPRVILHICMQLAILGMLFFAGDHFIGNLHSFNPMMIAIYILVATLCNVIGVEIAWRCLLNKETLI